MNRVSLGQAVGLKLVMFSCFRVLKKKKIQLSTFKDLISLALFND